MVSPLISFGLIWGSITAAAALTVLAWRERPKPGAQWFAVVMAAGTWWVATSSIGLFTLDPARRLLLHRLEWLGLVVLPVGWVLFALDYTSHEEYISRVSIALLSVVPAVSLVLALTTDAHGLVYASRSVAIYGDVSIVEQSYGPWFWVAISYTYALLGVGTLLILQLIVDARSLYRGQALALLITVLAPWLGNIVFVTGQSPVPNFDPTPFMFLISGAAGIAALTQFKLLDSVPVSSRVAYATVIESMDDGVVVTDTEDRIVEMNQQAAAVLDCTVAEARDRPAATLLPAYESLRSSPDGDTTETVELDTGTRTTYHELTMTPLRDDKAGGSVVVIHDVTERRNRVQQLDVLNRVLRHNLRNEMNVVYGYADQLDDSEAVDRIQEKAMTMVNLGNKAREIDEILHEGDDGDPIDLTELLDIESERAREAFPEVTVDYHPPSDVGVVPRTLGPVVRNLLENAAEHNDSEQPSVTLTGSLDGDTATVEVRDNGPGMPEEERAVLRTGEETPLQHSSGLGLWLVNWGVETMGGTVSVETSTDGTAVRVTVPTVGTPTAATGD